MTQAYTLCPLLNLCLEVSDGYVDVRLLLLELLNLVLEGLHLCRVDTVILEQVLASNLVK
jgi:hypothetical protein